MPRYKFIWHIMYYMSCSPSDGSLCSLSPSIEVWNWSVRNPELLKLLLLPPSRREGRHLPLSDRRRKAISKGHEPTYCTWGPHGDDGGMGGIMNSTWIHSWKLNHGSFMYSKIQVYSDKDSSRHTCSPFVCRVHSDGHLWLWWENILRIFSWMFPVNACLNALRGLSYRC